MDLVYRDIGIEVTRRCNQQCRDYCMRGPKQNLDIPLEFIDLLLDLDRNHYKAIETITFSGGEPTLNVLAIAYTIDKIISEQLPVFHVSLMTNGLIYSDLLVASFERFNDYYNSFLLPMRLAKYPPAKKALYLEENKDKGSSIGFSDDQYHKPISNDVLDAYYTNGSHISYSKTGNRKEEDILYSGFSKQGYSLESRKDDIRIFGDYVLDLIYLTAKGNLSSYGDGSFDFLDETSKNFSISNYTLSDFCFEKISPSSRVGRDDPVFRAKTKFLKKRV